MKNAGTTLTVLFIALVATTVESFAGVQPKLSVRSANTILFMDENESSSAEEAPKRIVTAADLMPQATKVEPIETDADYPLPLPSPLLLGGSMVLGIASTGRLREEMGGSR